jgi:hypothetical protein
VAGQLGATVEVVLEVVLLDIVAEIYEACVVVLISVLLNSGFR